MTSEMIIASKVDAKLKTIKIKEFTINYVETGSGPILLLIHGANLGWGQWLPNIKDLAQKYRVIALDLPGSGRSTQKNFRHLSFEKDFVQTASEFIQQLKLSEITVVGHSFGAAIAIKLAADPSLNIKKTVLVSPLGFSRHVPTKQKLITVTPFAKMLSKTALKPTRDKMEKFLKEPLVQTGMVNQELVNYYWEAVASSKHNHPILFMNSLTKPFALRKELHLVSNLRAVNKPILVIMGDSDPMIPISKIKSSLKDLPNIKVVIFKNCGHVPSLEYPEKFNQQISIF